MPHYRPQKTPTLNFQVRSPGRASVPASHLSKPPRRRGYQGVAPRVLHGQSIGKLRLHALDVIMVCQMGLDCFVADLEILRCFFLRGLRIVAVEHIDERINRTKEFCGKRALAFLTCGCKVRGNQPIRAPLRLGKDIPEKTRPLKPFGNRVRLSGNEIPVSRMTGLGNRHGSLWAAPTAPLLFGEIPSRRAVNSIRNRSRTIA